MVNDVNERTAFDHPIPNARSTAELLAHIIAWNEIVGRRIIGEQFDVTQEMDFPHVDGMTWSDLLKRLDAAHARLIENVRKLRDEDLKSIVPGKKHNIYVELHGLMHHNTYHAAQIAMLKKF
jgi:hypothetical protein